MGTLLFGTALSSDLSDAEAFRKNVEPVLAEYCYDCHGDGSSKGNFQLDAHASDAERVRDRALWLDVMKNVRAGIMPPEKRDKPSAEQWAQVEEWIHQYAFLSSSEDPDPGHVTLRRLNRVEYRNTIRDLMGTDFRTDEEFPADDTGYGFDTIGDVLAVSPLLLEKYLHAAQTIVDRAVPRQSRVIRETVHQGREFRSEDRDINGGRMDFYEAARVSRTLRFEEAGMYRLRLGMGVRGAFDFDPGRCHVRVRLDDELVWEQELGWGDGRGLDYELEREFEVGRHTISVELEPLLAPEEKRNSLDFRVQSLTVQGPLDESRWIVPENYSRFFPRDNPPTDPDERREYAQEVLEKFTHRAFRRPADAGYLTRLVDLAEVTWKESADRFEDGIAQAFVVVLASPRFLFRMESTREEMAVASGGESSAESTNLRGWLIDEYALAARLSYFLWSSMPDDRLLELADEGRLREELSGELRRMLNDEKASAFVENFTGQWLQIRDVEGVPINGSAVLRRDGGGRRFNFDQNLRRSMRRETEATFEYILKEDRSLLELIDSDYVFVNESLVRHYDLSAVAGASDVRGDGLRRVSLDPGHARGGILTQGSVLAVTSNPTRTSPVKRGLFILENILGMPAPPAPPDVPELEETAAQFPGRDPGMREMMEAHRNQALCRSCHARMDPLGLALENFNAMGMWRETEAGNAVDPSGQLISGHKFAGIKDLKQVLVEWHATDFYRCLTEKMLVYALGRGLNYHDVETVDRIVAKLEAENGKISVLMNGIIESAPFQKRRNPSHRQFAKETER